MKTPEEIKKGLMLCCITNESVKTCIQCPYYDKRCVDDLLADAYAYIEQLEETIALMKIQMEGDCGTCKHKAHDKACITCLQEPNKPLWEYEGLPQLPGKDERHEKPV